MAQGELKHGNTIKWILQTMKNTDTTSKSDLFVIKDCKCYFSFYYGYIFGPYKKPLSLMIGFNENQKLNSPVEVIISVSSDSRKFPPERHTITGECEVKLWSSTDTTIRGSLLTLEMIMDDCVLKDYEIMRTSQLKNTELEQLHSETSHIHLEALSKDFGKLLDDHLSSDVDVTCKDKTFKVHRIVLSARSEVLEKMLNSSMTEGTTGQIKVEDCEVPIFQSFLRYLYSGKVPGLSLESATQLYEVSDKYGVLDLRRACSDYLKNHLTDDNAYEILILADQHSDEEFRKNVVSYMIDRKIPQRDSHWSGFCKNHCNLANEVMLLYIQKYCPK